MTTPVEPTEPSPEPVTPPAPEPQAPAAEGTPAAPVEPAAEPGTGAQPQEGTPAADPWSDPEAARKEIEKLRRENAAQRTKAKDRDELAAQVAEFKKAQMSAQERLEAERDEALAQAQRLRAETVRARIEALATPLFADWEDAAGALDPASYVDAAGAVDAARIQADLNDLLVRKPHWAKPAPPAPEPPQPRRPAPDLSQGSGANEPKSATPEREFEGWFKHAVQQRR